MSIDLLDHTARLLEREPSHCMTAGSLHCRAAAATGSDVPLGRFLHLLAAQADRFAVIPACRTVENADGWSPLELRAYDEELAAAPGAEPLVVLTERCADPLRTSLVDTAGEPFVGSATDVLQAVHEALVEVLQSAATDPQLFGAARACAHELEAVGRRLAG